MHRYHEDRMINYDHEDGVSVASKLTSSILTVRNATARHGGKLNETKKKEQTIE